MSKILIIEDEVAIADLEKDYLELSGFDVKIENRGDKGLQTALKEDFDLIILDLMLPGMDGFEVCRKIREEKNVPILMVSAKKDDIDKIRGLGLGADDYITKPYSLNVLCAKVKAVLKRYENSTVSSGEAVTFGDIRIDTGAGIVKRSGREVELTAIEYKLLSYLVENRNKVVNKQDIFDNVWDDSYVSDGTLNVHIRHLREKLEKDPNEPRHIKTARGRGYIFRAD